MRVPLAISQHESPLRGLEWYDEYTNRKGITKQCRTNLFSEHTPFEFGQVFHRPDVIPPPSSLLSADRLSIKQVCDRTRNLLVQELNPSFCEVNLFCTRVLLSKIRAFCVYGSQFRTQCSKREA